MVYESPVNITLTHYCTTSFCNFSRNLADAMRKWVEQVVKFRHFSHEKMLLVVIQSVKSHQNVAEFGRRMPRSSLALSVFGAIGRVLYSG